MAAVYMRSWLCVGRAQQIPTPATTLALTLADEPILVVRGNDGEIRAMTAVCRHRGHAAEGRMRRQHADLHLPLSPLDLRPVR